jgi:hypothetical protein
MNKHTVSMLRAMIVALICLGTESAVAHPQNGGSVATVSIPLSFEYNAHQLPAVKYAVSMLTERVLRFQGASISETGLTLPGTESTELGSPRLVFHRYSDHYFLANIVGADGKRRFFVESKNEKELRHNEHVANSHGIATSQLPVAEVIFTGAR